jgi:hypothetical protein
MTHRVGLATAQQATEIRVPDAAAGDGVGGPEDCPRRSPGAHPQADETP